MSSSISFDFSDLKKFGEDLDETSKAMKTAAPKFMKNEARTLARRAVKLASSRVKVKTGNYLKGFKGGKKVYAWPDAEYNVRTYNSAPHAHLIEDGHQNHLTGTYTPGKHILRDAANAYQEEFADHIEEKLLPKLLEELEK